MRRIERQELELREMSIRDSSLDEYEIDWRRGRRRVLRNWLRADEEALRVLLGGMRDEAGGE